MAIADLSYTNNMAAAKKPALTDLVESLDSIKDYINNRKDDLDQLLLDCFGSSYTFNQDGLADFANMTLYNKLSADDSYTGGDVTLSVATTWTDIDAVNAAVSITPEVLDGDFLAIFQFCVECVSSNATNEADLRFRLTDGTENSTMIAKVHQVTGVITTTHTVPVTLIHEFSSWTTSSKTVKLQYYRQTYTNMVAKVLANSDTPITMHVEKL